MNYSASQLVNFDVIRDMILKGDVTDKVTCREKLNEKGSVGE